MLISRAITGFVFATVTAWLPAHGGQYRGPTFPPPPEWGPSPRAPMPPADSGRPPVPPITGGPTAPGAPTPTPPGSTPGATALGDLGPSLSWESWWEFNKDPFVGVRLESRLAPVTGSDDFYLGFRRPEASVDLLSPTKADRTDRIVPVLAGLLDRERNHDIATACLVALGKVGLDAPGVELESTIAAQLSRDDQEVRETAVLALGIAGRPAALPTLLALLHDDAVGRKLVDRSEVALRTRTFAAYGLGLLAMRSDEVELKTRVHDALWPLLRDRSVTHRELRTAAVTALGILRCGAVRGAQKRLQWQTVEELLAWFSQDLGRGDEIVQAHAPIAIARLLGRGSSLLHQQSKAAFAAALAGKARRSNPIQQSAAIALGMLVVAEEQAAEDAPFAVALREYYEQGHDRQARSFAVLGLGRIGGTANRSWLLQAYERSNRGSERPWLALALGLLGDGLAKVGKSDATIARLLVDDLKDAASQDLQGALAIAVGLTGHVAVAPAVSRLLREREGEERVAGHLCVALALLGDQGSVPMLSSILERSARRPFLLLQSALALGRLGDQQATPRLLDMLRRHDSTAVLAGLAAAIGQIGDRRAIDPLVAMIGDAELTKLARAFVAAALGGLGDKDPLRWNLPLLVDCNYAAAPPSQTNGSTGVLDIL